MGLYECFFKQAARFNAKKGLKLCNSEACKPLGTLQRGFTKAKSQKWGI